MTGDPAGSAGQVRERVLFVDDEPRVLDGLRRMLRPMRKIWDMEFVGCGREAADMVRETGVTVLITDMQMPDMDGEALLDAVALSSPSTVRIVLSGHSSAEHLYRTMNKAHQYLTKPCQAETLLRVIEQACALRNTLTDDSLRETVSRMDAVPSPPSVYNELMAELERNECSMHKVGEIISTDVGITSRVLRLVNSAWFGFNRPITDMSEALLMLGIEPTKALVLSTHVLTELADGETHDLVVGIGEHSIRVAQLSRQIATLEQADPTCRSQAFTAGMMHEVGLMVLAANEPGAVEAAIAKASTDRIPLHEAERQLLNATHAQIGAYLLGRWGLPNPIVEAVAFLDRPSTSLQDEFSPLCATHVAEALIHGEEGAHVPASGLDEAYLERLGLLGRCDAWREVLAEQAQES